RQLVRSDGRKAVVLDSDRVEIASHCPDCVSFDGRHYFADWASLSTFHLMAEAAGTHDVRVLDRWLVSACAKWAPEGSEVSISRIAPRRVCRKPKEGDSGGVPASRVSYRVGKGGGALNIGMRLRLKIGPADVSAKRATEMLADARSCIPFVKDFW